GRLGKELLAVENPVDGLDAERFLQDGEHPQAMPLPYPANFLEEMDVAAAHQLDRPAIAFGGKRADRLDCVRRAERDVEEDEARQALSEPLRQFRRAGEDAGLDAAILQRNAHEVADSRLVVDHEAE